MEKSTSRSAIGKTVSRREFLLASGAVAGYLAFQPSQMLAAPTISQTLAEMQRDFANPPDASKPWVYWWWLDGVATPEGITADLEEMKKKGINGLLLFDCGSSGPLANKGPRFMSEEWRANFRHAVNEAARLNMEMGVNLCTGWDAGGPWVEREDAIKILVWREMTVTGPMDLLAEELKRKSPLQTVAGPLPATPENWHRDIVTFASQPNGAGTWQSKSALTLPLQHHEGVPLWRIPEGEWVILQFGYMLSGNEAKLASSGMHGWEIDPMSARALDRHFDNTAVKLIQDAGVHVGKTFKYTHIDSWEINQPSWTQAFEEEFKKRRGYDPLPYLPALAGKTVDSADLSERFTWDYRRTIADLVQENYYGQLTARSHPHNLGTHSEAGGPFFRQYVDALHCLGENDIPMGEFWSTRNVEPDKQSVPDPFFHTSERDLPGSYVGCVRQAASAARIYGKAFCQAESFTGFDRDWVEDPYYLKADGDRAFCVGLGRCVIHHYASVPDFGVMPGNQWEHISIHFNRNVTWWDKCHAWLRYLARCQHLLRQGAFVAELLFYSGEAIPNFVLTDQKPVPGFDFDCINADALVRLARVKDKRVDIGNGTTYGYLIIPGMAGENMSVAVLTKLREMVTAGMTLVATPPMRTPGLANYRSADAELHRIAAELWGGDAGASGEHKLGRGRVLWGISVDDLLQRDNVRPDVEVHAALRPYQVDWIHRRSALADIYFIANHSEEVVESEISFRVAGRTPVLFDAVQGTSKPIQEAREAGGRTVIPMRFAAKQSFFVVFPSVPAAAAPPQHPALATFPALQTEMTLEGPWSVAFDPAWGAPAHVTFPHLEDWTRHHDDGIRHYSGKAVYTRTFQHSGRGKGRCYLDLGLIKNVAEVTLNGKNLGVVWTAPWHVDVTDVLREGDNDLSIEIVNLWPNRLIKDGILPEAQRLTSTNVRTYQPVVPDDLATWGNPADEDRKKAGKPAELFSSGLLGPVTLMREG
jgi:hypothetical protein